MILHVVVSTYLLTGALLFLLQRNLLYFPTEKIAHGYTTEVFSSGGEAIEVNVLNSGSNKALLYFGGNGEQVVANAPAFADTFPERTVYLVNYRGYSGSTGKPSEAGIVADAEHIYARIAARHRSIAVMGRSLGSGVAIHLASKMAVEKLVLVTPYDSIQRIAQDRFPIYPMTLLLRDKFDSLGKVNAVRADTLVILAEHDQVISRKYSEGLIAAFPKTQVTSEVIANAGHNNLSGKARYYDLLQAFL